VSVKFKKKKKKKGTSIISLSHAPDQEKRERGRDDYLWKERKDRLVVNRPNSLLPRPRKGERSSRGTRNKKKRKRGRRHRSIKRFILTTRQEEEGKRDKSLCISGTSQRKKKEKGKVSCQPRLQPSHCEEREGGGEKGDCL